jgi:hypothetical protein
MKLPDQSDHDLLIRLDENIKTILRQMSNDDTRADKLELRLANLENFRWFILGGAAALGFISGLIARYFFK